MSGTKRFTVGQYRDDTHAEDPEGLMTGEHGYKFRLVDGVVMPPYVTPARYRLSRTVKTRPGDICYISYPKSGSTWLAYILVLIVNGGRIPTDRKTLRDCLHWVESSWTYPRSADELEALPSPRIFKSHMPYQMALGGDPEQNPCKYIYIARNPKDVAVSYYFFEREKSWSGHYAGSWSHWLEVFREGKVQRGSWFDHVLSWWAHRDAPNILFLRYEDLRADFGKELSRIVTFLGRDADEDMLERIRRMASFDAMRKERFSNMHEIEEFQGFFRKGEVGSWSEQFTPEQSDAFDALYEEITRGTGLDLMPTERRRS
jgi:sulfotransferase